MTAATAGALVILSPNPIHDTGGGQRSAQLAQEFLARNWAVLFVSHGVVTETVDLRLNLSHPLLLECHLNDLKAESGFLMLAEFLAHPRPVVLTQVPVAEWMSVVASARKHGAVTVYDLIDDWNSELGAGWYRRRSERRMVAAADLLVATAPALQRRLAADSGRAVTLVPNAYNQRLFSRNRSLPRPADLPPGPVALYVGALWGKWMHWHLIAELARLMPHVAFTFVGDHRGEGAGLPPNCHFLGLKPQASLPAYLQHAAVGVLPWSDSAVTQATSPLKVYEYLAMGLRVVAPDLEPLRHVPGIACARNSHDFAKGVGEAVSAPSSSELCAEMDRFAAGHNWAARADLMVDLIDASRRSPRRRTLRNTLREWTGV